MEVDKICKSHATSKSLWKFVSAIKTWIPAISADIMHRYPPTVFVFQRFHRWKTSFITIYNCTVWRQHLGRVWNTANINPHAKPKLLPSAGILVVSVTTMLILLNMINHIRKHTDKRRKLLLKLINDPSWTSQNTTDDVHSNSTKEAPPPLGALFFSCHCTPVSSSPPLLAEFFSSPLAPSWMSIPQGKTWRHRNKCRKPKASTAEPDRHALKKASDVLPGVKPPTWKSLKQPIGLKIWMKIHCRNI